MPLRADAWAAAMTFPETPRVQFKENPLAQVVCQLRFPTILAIAQDPPAGFQERIRRDYPVYQRQDAVATHPPELSALMAQLPIQLPQDATVHNFRTEDEKRTITLTPTYLALADLDYTEWDIFRGELDRAKQALEEIYSPSFYSRIGLEYQDGIERARLGLESTPWADLLVPEITGLLNADDPIRNAVKQLQGAALIEMDDVDGGLIRLQYGLGESTATGEQVFVVDADLYTESRHDGSQVDDILARFNREAGNLWRWAIKPGLRDALGEINAHATHRS